MALLSRLVLTPRAVMDDYLYYATPSPWLQVRLTSPAFLLLLLMCHLVQTPTEPHI